MKINGLNVCFWPIFRVWMITVVGGSMLVAVSMVVHSDVIHAEMPYRPYSIPGVTFLSSIAALLCSLPTVVALLLAWAKGQRTGWSSSQAMIRLQALHAFGAAITFGIILYQDFDVFSVVCTIEYPAVGALLWGRLVRQFWHVY